MALVAANPRYFFFSLSFSLICYARSQTSWPSMTHSSIEIIQAYRRLYREGLHAVQYASPARHILKCQLNQAFRESGAQDFDAQKIENTLLFLKCAAKEKGIEHRILKTLLHVRWHEMKPAKQRSGYVSRALGSCASHSVSSALNQGRQLTWKGQDRPFRDAALGHFKTTLKMFNQSMVTCLPEKPLAPP